MSPSTDRAVVEAWRLLVQGHGRLIKVFRTDLAHRLSLKLGQFDALRWLHEAEGHRLRTQELAAGLLYTSGAATKVIDRLFERGLVSRADDPDDRRVTWVQLTPEGLEVAEHAIRTHVAHVAEVVPPFASDEERRHVLAYLSRLADEPAS